MIEQRRHATCKYTPLLAKMLVAMHHNRSLLRDSSTNAIRSLVKFRKIRARVNFQVAEHPRVISAGKATEQHCRIGIGEIDAISRISKQRARSSNSGMATRTNSSIGCAMCLTSNSVSVCGGPCRAGSSLWSIKHRRHQTAIRDSDRRRPKDLPPTKRGRHDWKARNRPSRGLHPVLSGSLAAHRRKSIGNQIQRQRPGLGKGSGSLTASEVSSRLTPRSPC